jgi:hypothetical protein
MHVIYSSMETHITIALCMLALTAPCFAFMMLTPCGKKLEFY